MEAIECIKSILQEHGIEYIIYIHDEIPTVESAKEKVNFDITKCFKTIAFKYEERFIFVSLKAEDSIDYNKLCSHLNIKRKNLKKANSNELEEIFGYELGGIAPISVSNKIAVIFDKKITSENIVFCGSGRRECTIEIAAKDLIQLSSGVMDISKSRVEELNKEGEGNRDFD